MQIKEAIHNLFFNVLKLKENDTLWLEFDNPSVGSLMVNTIKNFKQNTNFKVNYVDVQADILRLSISKSNIEEREFVDEMMRKMKLCNKYIRFVDDGAISHFCSLYEQFGIKELVGKRRMLMSEVTRYRVNNLKWVVSVIPSIPLANFYKCDFDEFSKMIIDGINLNYAELEKYATPLIDILNQKGKTVRIYSDARFTDLTFKLSGAGTELCAGKINIPDGEVFTSPELNSVNGTIMFGPSYYNGEFFKYIYCEFKDGVCYKSLAESEERTNALNKILDVDPGARKVGEFALGLNTKITKSTGFVLTDEKVFGSIHLALGKAYETMSDNGNRLANHWDLVHNQQLRYGGGALYIDGVLIRKDGLFVPEELTPLNTL